MRSPAETRRLRLLQLSQKYGKPADFARHIRKDPRQVSAWLVSPDRASHKKLSDEVAREIEEACRLPEYWLDSDASTKETGDPSHPARTDRGKMADAMRLLQELAELQGVPGLVVNPIAISIAYDFLVEFDSPLTESNVLDITKRLAAILRGETNATQERSSAA
jgi:hypothetical protein